MDVFEERLSLLIVLALLLPSRGAADNKYTLNGTIKSAENGELLIALPCGG
jgi:hypothetical protein